MTALTTIAETAPEGEAEPAVFDWFGFDDLDAGDEPFAIIRINGSIVLVAVACPG